MSEQGTAVVGCLYRAHSRIAGQITQAQNRVTHHSSISSPFVAVLFHRAGPTRDIAMQAGSCDPTRGTSSSVFWPEGIRIARSRDIDGFELPIDQCGEP